MRFWMKILWFRQESITLRHGISGHAALQHALFLYPLSQKSKIFDSSPKGRAKAAGNRNSATRRFPLQISVYRSVAVARERPASL